MFSNIIFIVFFMILAALVKGHLSGNIRIDEDIDESNTVKSGCNCTIQ